MTNEHVLVYNQVIVLQDDINWANDVIYMYFKIIYIIQYLSCNCKTYIVF